MQSVQELALMFLAVAIYNGIVTEDEAMKMLLAMDDSAVGTDLELEARADAVTPILVSLEARYAAEGQNNG